MENRDDRYVTGEYLQAHPDWHDADGPWKAGHVRDLLTRNQLSPKVVCDLGCGTGRVLDELSRLMSPPPVLQGIDLSTDAIEVGRRRANSRVTLRVGDLGSVPHRCDVLLLLDVFEHVPDYLGLLRALHGRADHYVFHVPLDLTLLNLVRPRAFDALRDTSGHLHYFTRETALAVLRDTGFIVVDSVLTAGALDRRGTGWRSAVAAVPRGLLFRLSPRLAARTVGGFSLLVLCRSVN